MINAKQTTVLLLVVMLLFAVGARDKIAHHLRALSFLERLGAITLCVSLFVLIALRALGIMDIIEIISPHK